METPEQRDALKTAQMFVNSVEIDTVYDNTAFIDGLAAILSRGQGAELRGLRKVEREVKRRKTNNERTYKRSGFESC